MAGQRILWAASLVCAICGCSPADDVSIENMPSSASLEGGGTQFGATIDGVMWYWNVSWKDVKDTPDWVPGEEPAVSMPQAIAIAQSEMAKYADTPQAYRLDNVQWVPIDECCDPNHSRKWIYVVDFERADRFASGARGTIRVPVLLDGRAIAGMKEGATKKE